MKFKIYNYRLKITGVNLRKDIYEKTIQSIYHTEENFIEGSGHRV
jgi:hypothetical protein